MSEDRRPDRVVRLTIHGVRTDEQIAFAQEVGRVAHLTQESRRETEAAIAAVREQRAAKQEKKSGKQISPDEARYLKEIKLHKLTPSKAELDAIWRRQARAQKRLRGGWGTK